VASTDASGRCGASGRDGQGAVERLRMGLTLKGQRQAGKTLNGLPELVVSGVKRT